MTVILTIPLPDKPIGNKIILPKEIKNKKCIIGFENVENNLCFWYCLAYLLFEGRTDRLKHHVTMLFQQYYGKKLFQLPRCWTARVRIMRF
jgi:hypothetical protein